MAVSRLTGTAGETACAAPHATDGIATGQSERLAYLFLGWTIGRREFRALFPP
ncbi:hypothetical protein QCN27_15145 [Cereibacter sp. SYSU M97828]|nr:hypothetical protein [Cereibacter flavus]